jgi:hypothetical protein
MANGIKVVAQNNIYTTMLAVALAVVLASAVYVTFASMTQYEALFKVVRP